jgi:hypothetical protein
LSRANLEREIRHLLNHGAQPQVVADELVQRWRMNLFSEEEQDALASFLLHAGCERQLLTEIERLLKSKSRIPWMHFIAALSRAGLQLSETQIGFLKDALREQSAWYEFAAWPPAAKIDIDFELAHRECLDKNEDEISNNRMMLMDQVQFFRSQRMHEEEAQALKKLQSLFPDDSEFRLSEEDLAERWARDVLANYSSRSGEFDEAVFERNENAQPEVRSAREVLTDRSLEIAKAKPENAYDLAVMFLFMESYAQALAVLEHAPASTKKDWLRVELLLKAREYALALDETNRLESTYAGDPESTFAAIYGRARALWGLGQAAMAVELIRSIVNVRPNYKSARSLLADWGGEA